MFLQKIIGFDDKSLNNFLQTNLAISYVGNARSVQRGYSLLVLLLIYAWLRRKASIIPIMGQQKIVSYNFSLRISLGPH